ncbi:sigma-70 family RNA polymerase sigma factor [Dactylosporangium sp. CA-092794]|uniref:sigma-70 family RNA polymerase sigma factor n=1 Tax=Dactylosporangium sp. CA-092794 TaxID=3239929 RepID=UPI003D8ED898
MTEPASSATEEPIPDEVFQRLYDQHGTAILNHLVRLTHGDWHRAEDILQETLVRAWRHPEARSANGEWSRAWLLTVARRIAIDHVRASMSRPSELGDDRLDERRSVDDGVDRLVDKTEVRMALADLPDRLRDVLIEVYYRDLSGAEAAESLGVPVGTVKSRTYYALRALREALIERGYLEGEEPPAGTP